MRTKILSLTKKMKKSLLVILLLPFFMLSQESETSHLNFKITESSNLIWQKVYESDATLEELVIFFKNNGFTSNIVLNGNKLSGLSGRSKIGDSKTKLWHVFGSKFNFEAFISIEAKEGRYRVTITEIRFVASNGSLGNTFSDIFIKRNKRKFKKAAGWRNSLTAYDEKFDLIFSLKEVSKDNDW